MVHEAAAAERSPSRPDEDALEDGAGEGKLDQRAESGTGRETTRVTITSACGIANLFRLRWAQRRESWGEPALSSLARTGCVERAFSDVEGLTGGYAR